MKPVSEQNHQPEKHHSARSVLQLEFWKIHYMHVTPLSLHLKSAWSMFTNTSLGFQ